MTLEATSRQSESRYPRLIVDAKMVLFIGNSDAIPAHRCGVPVVGAGLDRTFELRVGQSVRDARLLLVPAGVMRSVNAFGGRLGVLMLDPALEQPNLSPAGPILTAVNSLADSFELPHWDQLSRYITVPARTQQLPEPVIHAARAIADNCDGQVPAQEIAASIGLSTSRLEHLFSQSMGTPMGTYRTWCRLRLVAREIAAGASITQAAHRAGFHDSAHFTRMFKRAFGLAPSMIFRPDLQIHVV